jgi:hypothetical protein
LLGVHPDRVRKQEGIITKAKYGVKGKRGKPCSKKEILSNTIVSGILKHPGISAAPFQESSSS